MICPFCGSTDIHGPSRVTADWHAPAGSATRQWYIPSGPGAFMACGNCHEEFDAVKWFGTRAPIIVVSTAA
jgi:RNA polymerase subunit RPABC4/transcription elongation factor Spt4